jgi:hypothetical protein
MSLGGPVDLDFCIRGTRGLKHFSECHGVGFRKVLRDPKGYDLVGQHIEDWNLSVLAVRNGSALLA